MTQSKLQKTRKIGLQTVEEIKILIFFSLLLYYSTLKKTAQLPKPNEVHSLIAQKNETESVKLSDKTMDSEKRLGGHKLEKAIRSAAEDEGEDEDEDDQVMEQVNTGNRAVQSNDGHTTTSQLQLGHSTPKMKEILAKFHLAYHLTDIDMYTKVWFEGGPETSGLFSVSWQLDLKKLNTALERFAANMIMCLLHLQVTKTEVFTWSEEPPPQAPQVTRAGIMVREEEPPEVSFEEQVLYFVRSYSDGTEVTPPG